MKAFSALRGAATVLLAGTLQLAAAAPQSKSEPVTIHSTKVSFPASHSKFPPGAGSDTAGKCLICHSAGMVLQQPLLSRKEWEAEINKMRNVYGAPLTDDDVAVLTTYMTRINAEQQKK